MAPPDAQAHGPPPSDATLAAANRQSPESTQTESAADLVASGRHRVGAGCRSPATARRSAASYDVFAGTVTRCGKTNPSADAAMLKPALTAARQGRLSIPGVITRMRSASVQPKYPRSGEVPESTAEIHALSMLRRRSLSWETETRPPGQMPMEESEL
jgi:hypothetical protein